MIFEEKRLNSKYFFEIVLISTIIHLLVIGAIPPLKTGLLHSKTESILEYHMDNAYRNWDTGKTEVWMDAGEISFLPQETTDLGYTKNDPVYRSIKAEIEKRDVPFDIDALEESTLNQENNGQDGSVTVEIEKRKYSKKEEAYIDLYFESVKLRISKYFRRTSRLDRLGVKGYAVVKLAIKGNGEVEKITFLEKPFNVFLEASVLYAIEQASPFIPFKKVISRKDVLELYILFRYRE